MTGWIRRTVALSFLALASVAATKTTAQTVEDALAACLAVEDEGERLACFEALARERQAAPAPPGPTSSPAASSDDGADVGVARSRPAAGGDRFGLPEIREPQPAEDTRREMTLAEARRIAGGKGLYVMDNGQIWTLVTGTYRPVEAGARVVIEEALFGSYRMIIGGRGYRVRRVR